MVIQILHGKCLSKEREYREGETETEREREGRRLNDKVLLNRGFIDYAGKISWYRKGKYLEGQRERESEKGEGCYNMRSNHLLET